MKIKVFILIFLISFLIACESQKRKEYTSEGVIIREFYPNKKIKSEGIYIQDSIRNGWYKEYFENGNLKAEDNYLNGLREGMGIDYYENNIAKSKVNFKNGKADGISLYYYPDGKIKSEGYWVNGKEFGHSIFYFKNGQLDEYGLIDFEGHGRYIRKYDESGNIIEEKGRFLGQLQFSTDFDSVRVGKEVTAELCVGQPPECKTRVFYSEVDKNGKIGSLTELQIKNDIATFKKVFREKGKYKLISIGQMKDFKKNNMKSDTIYTNITVI